MAANAYGACGCCRTSGAIVRQPVTGSATLLMCWIRDECRGRRRPHEKSGVESCALVVTEAEKKRREGRLSVRADHRAFNCRGPSPDRQGGSLAIPMSSCQHPLRPAQGDRAGVLNPGRAACPPDAIANMHPMFRLARGGDTRSATARSRPSWRAANSNAACGRVIKRRRFRHRRAKHPGHDALRPPCAAAPADDVSRPASST